MNWEKPFEIIELTSHVDERGSLFEIIRFEDFGIPGNGQIYTFTILPGKRRGDHYHLHKAEWFTCVFGEATILLTTSDGKNASFTISDKKPTLVYAGPGTSHALINVCDTTAVIVSYGSTQHKHDDPDTFYFKTFPNFDISEV